MTDRDDVREMLVVYENGSDDRSVPPEILADLHLDAVHILRTSTVGFTAALTPDQRAAAVEHPLVTRLEPNPDRLAPHLANGPEPPDPDSYVALLAGGDPDDLIRRIGVDPSTVTVMGVWLIATLTPDQFLALRRDPDVDFVDFAFMDSPA